MCLLIEQIRRQLQRKHGVVLHDRIGEGGFAYVYRGIKDGVECAVKIATHPIQENPSEYKSLAILQQIEGHPHLITLLGYHQVEGHLVTCWELAQEGTLADKLQQFREAGHRGIPRDQLLTWMYEAAEAIEYLNTKGILHRDIKPQNIFLFGNSVKVGDLGIMKFVGADTTRHTGFVSMGYSPPEAYDGQLNRTIDIYGLAATYIKLRTGHEPFGTQDILKRQLENKPEVSELPAAEQGAIYWALAPNPKNRPQWGATEWVRFLEAACRRPEVKRESQATAGNVPPQAAPQKSADAGRDSSVELAIEKQKTERIALIVSPFILLMAALMVAIIEFGRHFDKHEDESPRSFPVLSQSGIKTESLPSSSKSSPSTVQSVEDKEDTHQEPQAKPQAKPTSPPAKSKATDSSGHDSKPTESPDSSVPTEKPQGMPRTESQTSEEPQEKLVKREIDDIPGSPEGHAGNMRENLPGPRPPFHRPSASSSPRPNWDVYIESTSLLPVQAFDVSQDGRWMAVAATDQPQSEQQVGIWDLQNKRLVRWVRGHTMWINDVAISPGGRILASGSQDDTVIFWDIQTGKRLHVYDHGSLVKTVTFCRGGELALVGGGRSVVGSLKTEKILAVLDVPNGYLCNSAISADGNYVVGVTDMGHVYCWNLKRRRVHQVFRTLPDRKGRVCLSPDGSLLLLWSPWNSDVRVIELPKGRLRGKLSAGTQISSVRISPDGKRAAIAAGGSVSLWDLQSGSKMFSLEGCAGKKLVFSLQGKQLVVGREYGIIEAWDLSQRRKLWRCYLLRPQDWLLVTSEGEIAGSPNGRKCLQQER